MARRTTYFSGWEARSYIFENFGRIDSFYDVGDLNQTMRMIWDGGVETKKSWNKIQQEERKVTSQTLLIGHIPIWLDQSLSPVSERAFPTDLLHDATVIFPLASACCTISLRGMDGTAGSSARGLCASPSFELRGRCVPAFSR